MSCSIGRGLYITDGLAEKRQRNLTMSDTDCFPGITNLINSRPRSATSLSSRKQVVQTTLSTIVSFRKPPGQHRSSTRAYKPTRATSRYSLRMEYLLR